MSSENIKENIVVIKQPKYQGLTLVISIFFFFLFSNSVSAATLYWVGSANGSTASSTNWSTSAGACTGAGNGTAPASADTLNFTASCLNNATISSTLTVTHISIASGYSGTITQNADVSLKGNFTDSGADTASWARTSGTFTISGSRSNSLFTCTGTFPSTVVVNNDGTFTLSSGCTITAGDTWSTSFNLITNNGTILKSEATSWTVNTTLVNNGVITHSGTGWTVRSFTNNATTTFTNGTTFTIASDFSNSGLITYKAGSPISIGGNWDARTGTFDTTGRTITFNGSRSNSLFTCTGTSTFPGTVVVNNDGTFTVASGCTITAGATWASPYAITNNGTILKPEATSWTISTSLVNNGVITHSGTGWTITGNFTNSANATTTFSNGTSLNIGANFTQSGNFTVASNLVTTINGSRVNSLFTCNGIWPGTVVVNNDGAFTVASGCTITAGDTWASTYEITNNGTILKSEATSWTINTTLVNNGVITHSGTGWTVRSFTNNATTTFTNGTSLTISGTGGNFTQSGNFTVSSGLVTTFTGQNTSTLTCTGTFPGTVTVSKNGNGGAFVLSTGCTVTASATWSANAAGPITNNGTINATSTWAITTPGGFTNAGIITHGGTSMAVTGSFTNTGTTTASSLATFSVSTAFSNSRTLTLGASTAVTFTTSMTNTGTITGGLTANVGTNFTNSTGTWDLTGKTVTFNTAGASTLTGTFGGSLVINKTGAANTFAIANSITVQNFTHTLGTFSNPGTAINLTVNGNLSVVPAAATYFGGANLSLIMSSSSDQTFSITTGTIPESLEINKTSGKVTLSTNVTNAAGKACTVTSGALYINGKTFTCGGTFTIASAGELQLQGAETVTTPTLSSGSTVTYVGDGDSATDSYTLNNWTYSNLTASSTDSVDTYSIANVLIVLGNLNVKGGTLTLPTTFTLGGNLIQTGGSINAIYASMILNGTDQTINTTATTTFYTLTKIATTSSQTLTFGTTSPIIITATTTLQGTSTYPLKLRSVATSTPWKFDPQIIVPGASSSVTQSFTATGTTAWTVPADITSVEVLVVGGGGGGGDRVGGGGGGGGVVASSTYAVIPRASISITVGSGGPGNASGSGEGTDGSNSVFGTLTAVGGGGGGGYMTNGRLGGSGGGAGGYSGVFSGSGTSGQGYGGGNCVANYGGGGGGGAGAVGSTYNTTGSGGGIGLDYSSIFGTGVGASGWFAGGGGGAAYSQAVGGIGGTGGGGNGGKNGGASPTSGLANTGGGGGGRERIGTAGNGGSGVVIIKYNYPAITATSTAPRNFAYLDVQDSTNINATAIDTTAMTGITDSGRNVNWNFGSVSSVVVGKSGTQMATTTIPVVGNNLGGAFTFIKDSGSANVTSIKIKQNGSLNADTYIRNLALYYQASSTCSSTKPSNATLFGNGSVFVNNYSTTTGTMAVDTGNVCLYAVYDTFGTSTLGLVGYTVDLEISNPSTDVIVSSGTASPATPVNISRSTMIVDDGLARSILSLKMADPTKNPTVYYLQNSAVWRKEGTSEPVRLTSPNLKVHSLTFTDLSFPYSAGTVRIQMTVSNVDPANTGEFSSVTKTYTTTANVKTYRGPR